jgi:hypothetical protein
MGLKRCFPELPGGGCWPREAVTLPRGCFPAPAVRPTLVARAPHNQRLQLPGEKPKEEVHLRGDQGVARS